MTHIHQHQQQFAIKLSLAVGVLMLIGKWYAYLITGSAAILSDAAESVVHIIAVAFAAYSMWLSFRPADSTHPYGHDKISYFSAGTEGLLIIVAAGFILYESILKLLTGITLENLDQGTFIIFGASVINLGLGGFLVWRGKKSGSLILIANGKHVLTDSWTSFGVVAGLMLEGGKLVRQSVGGLMDEADAVSEEKIRAVLDEETRNRSLVFHELRCRNSGNSVWIEFHLLFPATTMLDSAHRISTEIESRLCGLFDMPVHITTHLEPMESHDAVHVGDLKH